MDESNKGLTIPYDVRRNVDGWDQWRTTYIRWGTTRLLIDETDEGIHSRQCTKQRNNRWWMSPIKNYPYKMIYETTADEWDQRRTTHTRWYTKQLLMDEKDEGIRARWCTKQLLMDGPMKDYPHQMMRKATVEGWENLRNPFKMMHETTLDGREQWTTALNRKWTKQLLINETE